MSHDKTPSSAAADEDPFEMLLSTDGDDRAFGAFLLGAATYTHEVHDALVRALDDANIDVVGYAAQSLALQGDVAVLSRLIDLLDAQPGRDVNPVPWAVAVLGGNADITQRTRAHDALARLRRRGSPEVASQVDLLLGRHGWENLQLDILSDRSKTVLLIGWVAIVLLMAVAAPQTVADLVTVLSTPVLGLLIWSFDGRGRAALFWAVPLAFWNALAVYGTASTVWYGVMMALSIALTTFLIFNSGFTIKRSRT